MAHSNLAELPIDCSDWQPMTKAERDLATVDVSDRFADRGITAELGGDKPADWLRRHRTVVMAAVAKHGWCVVRGLGITEPTAFRSCISALDIPLVEDYGDLPMLPSDDGTTGVFNVTKYPAKNAILFHNEGSHTGRPPRHIFFQCSLPALQEGETPIAHSADVFAALPDEMQTAFAERGLLYRRNFVEGLDVSWSQYFHTGSRDAVEAICAEQDVQVHWRADGGLETEIRRPAVIRHPDSGADVFFNQVLLHHPACLEPAIRSGLQSLLNGRRFPREVYFGDGSSIPDEWIAEVLRAHIRVAVCFRWQAGDVVIADNHAVSHARRPFQGPRLHHVIMSR